MTDKCIVCSEQIDINTDLINMNYTKLERDIIYKKLIQDRKKANSEKLLGKKRHVTVLQEESIDTLLDQKKIKN